MVKITLVGAGSTVFARSVIGDCFLTDGLSNCEVALYDIDSERLEDSYIILNAMNKTTNNSNATIKKYLGVENRKEALRGSDFVITAIQVGGYEPSTVIDFEIPKKFGLRQTIADTLGIGGIFRALRSIPVFDSIALDMSEVCPKALLLNYVNPMGMITGYLQRYTDINTIGLCHSVQGCSSDLLTALDMVDKLEGRKELIAGINHMGWLLELYDKDGNDLYPEIRRRAAEKNKSKHNDMVRYEYINRLGYYCTESSEHNAEYNCFFIKPNYPELIERYNIPLDEYPRRCVDQIAGWKKERENIIASGSLSHSKTSEYASDIIGAVATGKIFKVGGNVLNNGLIDNLPKEACVEIPCMIDRMGVNPCYVGKLPPQLAAMNMTNINVQLLTIEAAHTLKKEHIYHAAMLDPITSGNLSIDDIVEMCDELIEAHGDYLPKYK